MPGSSLGKLFVELLLEDEQFQKDLDKNQAALKRAGAQMQRFGDALDRAVKTSVIAAGAAFAGLAAASAKVGASFEQQMAKVRAISGATEEDFAALSDEARRLGATTAFTATQAGEGLEQLARAGFSAEESIAAAESALKLAGATGLEMAKSTETIVATLSQFSMEADQSAEVADKLARVTSRSLFSMEGLATSMRFAGAAAASVGQDIDETLAVVAQFRDLGLEASQAGTTFRNAVTRLVKPSAEAEEAIASMGLSMADVDPTTRDLSEILITLAENGLADTERGARLAATIFGQRFGGAVASVSSKLATNQQAFEDLRGEIEGSAGTVTEMYGIMMDNVSGRLAEARSALEEVLLVLFEQFGDGLAGLLEEITGLFRAVGEELGATSTSIRQGLGGTLDRLRQMIRRNRDEWAETFALIIKQGGRALEVMVGWLPVLDDIAKAMAAIWVTTKVVAFGRALQTVSTALLALKGSVGGLGSIVSTVFLGPVGVVAAVGATTAAFIAWAKVQAEDTIPLSAATAARNDEMTETFATLRAEIDDVKASFEPLADLWQTFLNNLALGFEFATTATLRFINTGDSLAKIETDLLIEMEQRMEAQREAAAQTEAMRIATEQAKKVEEQYGDAAEDATDDTDGLSSALDGLGGSFDEVGESAEKTRKSIEGLGEIFAPGEMGFERAGDAIEALGIDLEQAALQGREFEGGFGAGIQEAVASLPSLQVGFERVRSVGGRALAQLGDAFSGVKQGIQSVKAAWQTFLDSKFVESLEKMVKTVGDVAGAAVRAGKMIASAFSTLLGGFDFVSAMNNAISAASEASASEREEAARESVRAAVTSAINFATALADALPAVLEELIAAVPRLFEAVISALPKVVAAIARLLPVLVQKIVAQIPRLIQAIVAQIPTLVTALADVIVFLVGEIPTIITAILEQIPFIITTVLGEIPRIIKSVIAAVPDIIIAVVQAIPDIITAIIFNIPQIVVALLESIFTELIPMLPVIAWELVKAIGETIWRLVKGIAEYIVLAIAKIIPGKQKIEKRAEAGELEFQQTGSAPDDVGTPGDGGGGGLGVTGFERPGGTGRDENPLGGGLESAPQGVAVSAGTGTPSGGSGGVEAPSGGQGGGASGGGGTSGASGDTIIKVYINGRLIDGAIVESTQEGHAAGVQRMIRREAGVDVGVDRGGFSKRSK